MQLGRVEGTVVASVKADGLEGVRLLIVQPLDRQRRPRGTALVAADAVATAGPGDLVHYVAAREAAQALRESFVPVDHAILGIVDEVDGPDPAVAAGPAQEPSS
jgi:ethanolamine utilization protein EutN